MSSTGRRALSSCAAECRRLLRSSRTSWLTPTWLEVKTGFRDLLGPDHPLTLVAESNAEVSQSALSSGSGLQANLADIDFTPLPL